MKNILIVLLLAGSVVLGGCNKKAETTGEKKEEVKPNQTQGTPTDNSANKDVQKGNQGNDLGMSAGLPSNFPSDIPQPKDGKCLGSLNSSDGTIVTFETAQSVKDVWEFYKAEMKKSGFEMSTDTGETLMNEKGGLAGWKKDKREVGLMLGANTDNSNKTSLVLTYK